MMLVVDDMHWADVASAQALSFVMRRLRNDHVLIRPFDPPRWAQPPRAELAAALSRTARSAGGSGSRVSRPKRFELSLHHVGEAGCR